MSCSLPSTSSNVQAMRIEFWAISNPDTATPPAFAALPGPYKILASTNDWTPQQSAALYDVRGWGGDFFSVGESGNVEVSAGGPDDSRVDLHSLVLDLRRRGLRTPMLLRFSDILASRISALTGAFESAIADSAYSGRYRGVYPIKVNQQRHIVKEIVELGKTHEVGLISVHVARPDAMVADRSTFADSDLLAAAKGCRIDLRASGREAETAVAELAELVAAGFDES